MLSNTLVTNEVKDAAGAEVEFERMSIDNAKTIFKKIVDDVANPIRMSISHQHTGSGTTRTRRSMVRFDKGVTNGTTGAKGTSSCYCVLSSPEGMIANGDNDKAVLAYLISFLASLGASTTILYDGTGNGAATLLNETL
jgi:hypothetical protein